MTGGSPIFGNHQMINWFGGFNPLQRQPMKGPSLRFQQSTDSNSVPNRHVCLGKHPILTASITPWRIQSLMVDWCGSKTVIFFLMANVTMAYMDPMGTWTAQVPRAARWTLDTGRVGFSSSVFIGFSATNHPAIGVPPPFMNRIFHRICLYGGFHQWGYPKIDGL